MEDDTEYELKKICCICLSIDRKLVQLCKINDGVNNLYFLLSYDPEAYKEGFFKESTSLHACWECRALLLRLASFRIQACIAQRQLSEPKIKHLKSLSRLSVCHVGVYDVTITAPSVDVDENFIDCDEVKTEIDGWMDMEDVPLSRLRRLGGKDKYSSDLENEEGPVFKNDIDQTTSNQNHEQPNEKHTKLKFNQKLTKQKVKTKIGAKNKYYKITIMNEKEMYESRDKRKEDALYADALSKCESCVEGFKSQVELEDHNFSKHVEKPNHNVCDICLSYIPLESYKLHRDSHHESFTCQRCNHVAYSLDQIGTHLYEHGVTRIKNNFKTSTARAMCKSRKHRMADKRTELGYQCTECSKYFENKNQRWKHVQRSHREGFSCHSCGKRFAFRHTLTRHEHCHSCGKRFAFRHTLTRHEQLHSGPQPRSECPVCHKMIRDDLTKIHARIHAPRERYSCAACDKTFVSRASYQHHLKYTMSHSNTDILKYKCSMCEKGYRSKGELRDHENYQHKGRTQHQCPVCGKGLATRRCITRHVRRAHHGVKESARDKICQQCGKAFRDKKGLREHESIHTGERPLSCEVCGCTFRQSASLYTHRKRVHKIHAPRKQVHLVQGQG